MKIKTASNGIVVALMAALSAYLFATAFQIHALEDILSPVNAILASGVLLFAYLRSTSRSINRISFLLNAIACFAWGAADTAWAIIAAGGQDPSQNPVLWVIYALTNVSLAFSFFIALVIQFSKWNKVQFMADALTIVALSGIMLWIGFFHKDSNGFTELLQMDFTSLLSIMLDILISVGVFQWFISVRSGHMPRYMLILAGSAALFALTDIAYYYFEFWQISVPSELTDFLYIASLAGLALGGVWKLRAQKAGQSDQPITNIGSRSRWVLLLIIPVFTLILDVTRFAKASITLMDYLFFAALIFLHWVFSRYIQISLENERLLAIEKLNNATLEKRVADQVRELTILANQDALTALRNRRFFISELEDRIHSALQEESLVVVVLDIDRFKMINDNYGPEVGDAVLMEFAGRLRGWQRENVTVARLGGDEFGLLFTEVYTNQQLEDICGALITLFHQPITLRGKTMQATVSLGVAARTANIDDGRLLLQNAEIALHQAKSQGYNRYQIFDPLYSRDIINANKIELLLRQADIETEFELFYQPQFSLPDRSLIGAEALIRWKNAEHGYISPSVFIPVAERTGYIGKIGLWVLREAIRQTAAWNSTSSAPLRVSVNISPMQLDDETFIDTLKTLLHVAKVDPAWLDIELTENVMIRHVGETQTVFQQLKDLGLSISIDDFGSGYSSMSYLNQFPFDRLKIDKSLIDSILSPGNSGVHIVKSVIDMSKTIGICTIAEGVERNEQLNLLVDLGCDQVQGFLLGRPVPADEFSHMFM